MTKEKSGISKIIITIAGKEVTCTPEQIKYLKQALDAMYPAPKEVIHKYELDWYRNVPKPFWGNPSLDRWQSHPKDVTLLATY